jgi:hypothetical protein
MQHPWADQRQRAAISASQRSPHAAETTPLRGYAGELTHFTGATRPYEKPGADLRLETVDSGLADNTPPHWPRHWSAGEAARMSPCLITSRMAAASRTSRERSPTK